LHSYSLSFIGRFLKHGLNNWNSNETERYSRYISQANLWYAKSRKMHGRLLRFDWWLRDILEPVRRNIESRCALRCEQGCGSQPEVEFESRGHVEDGK
jgi:hypothetical protein